MTDMQIQFPYEYAPNWEIGSEVDNPRSITFTFKFIQGFEHEV